MLYLLLILLLPPPSDSWSVLISNTFATGSHQSVSVYLANLLADNGHHVTYLSTNVPDLHEAVVVLPLPVTEGKGNTVIRASTEGKEGGGKYTWGEVFGLLGNFFGLCGDFLAEDSVQRLIETNTKKYDLFITFALFDTCGLALAHHLGIENTIIHAPGPNLFPYHLTYLGIPLYASSHNVDVLTIADPGNLRESALERFKQVVKSNLLSLFQTAYTKLAIEPAIRGRFPDYPGAKVVYGSVKMMFHHSHFHPLIDGPQPLGPGVVGVGGALCTPYQADKLGEKLKSFLDDSEGFIVISFGSLLAGMSPQEENLWISVFSKLPYRVVWKIKTVHSSSLPDNIMTIPWLPQKHLIQHPRMKLFITHGGIGSKVESFCAGVPMIIVPQFAADQFLAARHYSKIGVAESIFMSDDPTVEVIERKIHRAIEHHSDQMKVISRQMKANTVTEEQVLGYMDIVISGHSLLPGYQPWYQYLYLDIILTPIITIYLIKLSVKWARG